MPLLTTTSHNITLQILKYKEGMSWKSSRKHKQIKKAKEAMIEGVKE